MSRINSKGKHRGVIASEIKIYNWRVFDDDEKEFLACLKTYNNSDHEGGKHRAWNKNINRLLRFARSLIGMGTPPITPSNPVNTPGHVLILARLLDKKGRNGKEMR